MSRQSKWHERSEFKVDDVIMVDPIPPSNSKNKGRAAIIEKIGQRRLTVKFVDSKKGKYVDLCDAKIIEETTETTPIADTTTPIADTTEKEEDIIREIEATTDKLRQLTDKLKQVNLND